MSVSVPPSSDIQCTEAKKIVNRVVKKIKRSEKEQRKKDNQSVKKMSVLSIKNIRGVVISYVRVISYMMYDIIYMIFDIRV